MPTNLKNENWRYEDYKNNTQSYIIGKFFLHKKIYVFKNNICHINLSHVRYFNVQKV